MPYCLTALAPRARQIASAKALEGAHRVLTISTDARDEPDKRHRQNKTAVAGALKAGLRHVAYTSMPKPEPRNPVPSLPDHHGTEEAFKATGLPYTQLRINWYQENLSRVLPLALETGTWFTSAGKDHTAYISRDDVTRAIATSLASSETEKGQAKCWKLKVWFVLPCLPPI